MASVRVRFTGSTTPRIDSVHLKETQELDYRTFRHVHSEVEHYTIFTPNDWYYFDAFGRTVHSAAVNPDDNNTLSESSFVNATQSIYESYFAALVQTQLMSRVDSTKALKAKLFTTRTRLCVVAPVAYAMMTLLTLMLTCCIGIIAVGITAKTALKEEPVGLFGRAAVLLDSDVLPLIRALRQNHPKEKSVVALLKQKYTVKESRCWSETVLGNKSDILRVTDLEQRLPKETRSDYVKRQCVKVWTLILAPYRKLKLVLGRRREQTQAMKL